MKNRFLHILLWTQGLYTLLTAAWAIIDIDSFMKLTGPKTDIWLVKTVAAVLVSIGLFFLTCIFVRSSVVPMAVLAITSSLGLICIDFYYSSKKIISSIYQADGILQIIFVICWIFVLTNSRHRLQPDNP